jgi:hypothetical protein
VSSPSPGGLAPPAQHGAQRLSGVRWNPEIALRNASRLITATCNDEAVFPHTKPECSSMHVDPIARILISDPSSTGTRTGSGVREPVIHDPQHMASRLSPQMAPQFDLSPK